MGYILHSKSRSVEIVSSAVGQRLLCGLSMGHVQYPLHLRRPVLDTLRQTALVSGRCVLSSPPPSPVVLTLCAALFRCHPTVAHCRPLIVHCHPNVSCLGCRLPVTFSNLRHRLLDHYPCYTDNSHRLVLLSLLSSFEAVSCPQMVRASEERRGRFGGHLMSSLLGLSGRAPVGQFRDLSPGHLRGRRGNLAHLVDGSCSVETCFIIGV